MAPAEQAMAARSDRALCLRRSRAAVAYIAGRLYTVTSWEISMGSSVEPWLLEILVCPESKAPLVLEGEWLYSTDRSTRRRFAVKCYQPSSPSKPVR